jgi:hypothetical protein
VDEATFTERLRALGCFEHKAIALNADYTRTEHAHPYDAHVLAIAGEFVVMTADTRHLMKAGDDLILPAGTLHSESVGPEGAQLLVAAVQIG